MRGASGVHPAFRLTAVAVAIALGIPACGSLGFVKRRLPPPTHGPYGVTFRFEARSAKIVQLLGSWPENNWGAGQAQTGGFLIGQMSDADGDGIWELTVKLSPGRYQYKFKIDQVTWKEDPNNPQRTDDGYGGFNSLIDVR
jgi:hypothetical protein